MNLLGKIPKNYIPIIEFGIKHLFSYQIIPYLIFEFKFKKSLNVLGNAAITEFNLKNKPREFLIQIKKKQEIEETIKTIFHELTHCKQFAYNDLNPECSMWRNETINIFEYNHEDLPWEIEAEEVSKQLLEKYYANLD